MPPRASITALTALCGLCVLCALGTLHCKRRDPQLIVRDAEPSMLVPQVLAPVNGGSASGREIDAPLAWLFLLQAPVTTGSVPDVLVASQLPCGFQAMYGTVALDAPSHTLRVRVRARYTPPGQPPDRVTPCPTGPPSIQYVSLNTVRLGEYDVVDAALHPPGSHPVPAPVHLSVIPDDANAPSESTRWVRPCTVGQDAMCTAGGVCGQLPSTPGRGVCVPPWDAFLAVNRPCPAPTTQITLQHPGEYQLSVHSRPGPFDACLPACNSRGQCPPTLRCELVARDAGACVPL
jgi:hypothetical protein